MSEWEKLKRKKSWRDGVDGNAADWFYGIVFNLAWILPLMIAHTLHLL